MRICVACGNKKYPWDNRSFLNIPIEKTTCACPPLNCCLHGSVKTGLGPCCNQNFIFNDLCNCGCIKCFYCQIKCICIETLKELQKNERYSVFDGGHGLTFTYEQLLQEKIGKSNVKPKSGMRMLKSSASSGSSEQSFSRRQSRKKRKRSRKTGLVKYSSPSAIPKFDGDNRVKKPSDKQKKRKTRSKDSEIFRKSHSPKAVRRTSIKDKQRRKTVLDDNEIFHKSSKVEGRKFIKDKQRRKTGSESDSTEIMRKSKSPKAGGKKSTKDKQNRTVLDDNEIFHKSSKAEGKKSTKDKQKRKTVLDDNEIVRKSKAGIKKSTKGKQKKKITSDDSVTSSETETSKTELRKSIKNKQDTLKPGSFRFVPLKTDQKRKIKLKVDDNKTGKITNAQDIQRKKKADSNFETFEINSMYFGVDSKGKSIIKKPKNEQKKISILKQKSRVDDIKICDILRTRMENKYLNMKRDQIDCICPPIICKVDCQNACPDLNKSCYLCCVDPCGTKCY